MKTKLTRMALAALLGAAAQAASISTTATLNGTAALNASGAVSATGSGTLTNIGAVTFTATANLGSTAISGPITITVTSGGTLTGTLSLPLSILSGSSTNSSASVVITGGTGTYAGSTGTLSGNGTGSVGISGITFTFTGSGAINTSGGGTTNPIPTISAVLDAASYTPNIAQGSIFVVKGTSLSGAGFTNNSGFPLGTSLKDPATGSNVSITFTPASGGTGTQCYMVYVYNQSGVNQLAAVLPATLSPGGYNVTVSNGTTVGAPFLAQVVKSKFGLITRDSTGGGLASVYIFVSPTAQNLDAYTTQSFGGLSLAPASGGATLTAYGTGFGSYAGEVDNTGSPGYNFAANGHTVNAIVGGMTIPAAYAGRSPGSAGLDQVNIALPSNVPTGCAVTFQISFDGVLSAPTYLSIAGSGANACTYSGLTAAQLSAYDQGQTIYAGSFEIGQFTESVNLGTSTFSGKFDTALGGFTATSGYELTSLTGATSITTIQEGSCSISTLTSNASGTVAGGGSTYLDAGTVTIAGPAGTNLNGTMTESSISGYSLTLGVEGGGAGLPPGFPATNVVLGPGTYTVKGAGATPPSGVVGVGPFNASLTVGAPLTVTGGLPSTVSLASGVTVNFTGGNSSDQVVLTGSSSSTSGTGTNLTTTSTTFICYTTAGTGSITAPASITSQLPPTSNGILEIGSGAIANFTAPLVGASGNINAGFFASFGAAATSVVYK